MSLIDQQGMGGSVPAVEGWSEGTNLVLRPRQIGDRLAHMPEGVYDLSETSKLTKFIKVLLGDSGVGRVEKAALLARLQHSFSGSHFYDLDRFYGALFGAHRRRLEVLGADPLVDYRTEEEWDEIGIRDDQFRSRMEQLARAVSYGASPLGMELIAEALLSVDCDVYENFVQADRAIHSYEDLESLGTYGDVELMGTYGDLEALEGADPVGTYNRTVFTIVPKRPITPEEEYDLLRVVGRIKPADSIVRVRPGLAVHRRVPIRRATADSELWRIIKTPVGGTPNARPPFTGYQGEAWSHLSEVHGVAAYALTADGERWSLIGNLYDNSARITLNRAIERGIAEWQYTPDLALADMADVLSGRLVSDGIMVAHPYAGAYRGDPILMYLTSEWYESPFQYDVKRNPDGSIRRNVFSVDSYAVLDPGAGILYQQHSSVPHIGRAAKTRQNFWASTERPQDSEVREIIEVRFRKPVLMNYVTLELPKVPHTATFEAFDLDLQEWVPLRQWTITENGVPVIRSKVPTPTADHPNGDYHPYLSAANMWHLGSSVISPIRSNRVRVVAQRHQFTKGPVGPNGLPATYSLGVRRLNVGYRIRSREDIPEPDQDAGELGFATTVDARGNPITLSLSESTADAVLRSDLSSWRSEPMPNNNSVVNLYLDVRDDEGDPTVVDGLYIDPAKSGPHMNLYWADQPNYGSFRSDDRLVEHSITGQVYNRASGFTLGESHQWSTADEGRSAITFDNRDLGFEPDEGNWWIGMRMAPLSPMESWIGLKEVYSHTSGDPTDTFVLMVGPDPDDNSSVYLYVHQTTPERVVTIGTPMKVPVGQTFYVSLSCDKARSEVTLAVSDGTNTATTSGRCLPAGRPSDVVIGRSLTYFPLISGPAHVEVSGFFLKFGAVSPDPIETMAEHFDNYLLRPTPGSGRTEDWTDSALLRWHPSFSTFDRIEFRGGPANFYENLVWHPVERDYRLAKGYVHMPTTRARWLKLEFTDLVPEPLESYVPIVKHLRMFPPRISGFTPPLAPPTEAWAGLEPHMVTSRQVSYSDNPSWYTPYSPYYGPGANAGAFFQQGATPIQGQDPTALKYVADVVQLERMRDISWLYGYQPWQIGQAVPRFRETGPHSYSEYQLVDRSKLGFFVGINHIEAFRTDYTRDDDTRVYRDRFFDANGLEPGSTWNQDPGMLTSTTDQPEVVQSKPMVSRNPVWAVQFAALTSDAVQITPDDQFRDATGLVNYAFGDQDHWHVHGDATATYIPLDRQVRVRRDYQPEGSFTAPGETPIPGLMQPPVQPVFSYDVAEGVEIASQADGGLESALAPTSPGGMLTAAARVTAVTDLVSPLVLQLVGSDGTVLAEHSRFVAQGETAEWSVSYQIGAYDRGGYQLYHGHGLDDLPHPIWPDDPPAPTGEVPIESPDKFVRVRIIHRGGVRNAEWIVDRLSTFDDAMLWEFSNDGGDTFLPALGIRNNPDGVLRFPKPGNALVWRLTSFRNRRALTSIQVRPWYRGRHAAQVSVPHRAGNVSYFESELPIQEDPEFMVHHLPVPRWWWRDWAPLLVPVDGQPLAHESSLFLARSVTDSVDEPTTLATRDLSLMRWVGINPFLLETLDGGVPGTGFPPEVPLPFDQLEWTDDPDFLNDGGTPLLSMPEIIEIHDEATRTTSITRGSASVATSYSDWAWVHRPAASPIIKPIPSALHDPPEPAHPEDGP